MNSIWVLLFLAAAFPPFIHPAKGTKATTAELVKRLEQAKDGSCDIPMDSLTCRSESVYWLGRQRNAAATGAIVDILANDPYTSARVQAAKSLGSQKGKKVKAALKNALKDKAPVVRIHAAMSLTALGDRSKETLTALYAAAEGHERESWSTWGAYSLRSEKDTIQMDSAQRTLWQIEALKSVAAVPGAESARVLEVQAKSSDNSISEAATRLLADQAKPPQRR